jgi:hypothetical protein
MEARVKRTKRLNLAYKTVVVTTLAILTIVSIYVNLFSATQPVDLSRSGPIIALGVESGHDTSLILRAEGPVRIRSVGNGTGQVELILSIDSEDLQDLVEDYRNSGSKSSSSVDTAYILSNPELCKNVRDLDWIVYVHSAVFNSDRRQLLRDTWANQKLFKNLSFRVIFLVGLAGSMEDQAILKEEFMQHGDIVQGNFQDDYKNLTYKAVMGLRWISTYCPQARYGVKADDDTFMNIFAMSREMRIHNNRSAVILCPLWGENSMPILRERKSCMKWCVRKRELPGRTHFPQYCAGIGFAVSGPLIGSLYRASQSTPFFWIDDVYVTGLLVKKVSEEVKFINLIDRFTLQEEHALEQMKNVSEPVYYYFVHTHNRHSYVALWNTLMDRLNSDEKNDLSGDPSQFKISALP